MIKDNNNFTFIDLFAGIGGTRLGYERAGAECVFTSEWDKYSQITYETNYGDLPKGDICEIETKSIPNFDILLAGFPCQLFSIAGVSKKISLGRAHGFDDIKQGNLFFEIARILKQKSPSAFMLENVKNLLSHDKGNTFAVIMKILKELDYNVTYKIIDGGKLVPQHRERIYIVGFKNKLVSKDFVFDFPEIEDKKPKLIDILEKNVDPKYTLSDKLWNYLQNYAKKHKEKGNGFGFGMAVQVVEKEWGIFCTEENLNFIYSYKLKQDIEAKGYSIELHGSEHEKMLEDKQDWELVSYRDLYDLFKNYKKAEGFDEAFYLLIDEIDKIYGYKAV